MNMNPLICFVDLFDPIGHLWCWTSVAWFKIKNRLESLIYGRINRHIQYERRLGVLRKKCLSCTKEAMLLTYSGRCCRPAVTKSGRQATKVPYRAPQELETIDCLRRPPQAEHPLHQVFLLPCVH